MRLANSDPGLLVKFIEFLEKVFNIERKKLRFGIQISNDVSPADALNFWKNILKVRKMQFYKTIISPARGKGTYKTKCQYGVVIVYFNNVKLKRLMCTLIENIQ